MPMLANYASDSDSDSESGPSILLPPRPAAQTAAPLPPPPVTSTAAAAPGKPKRKGPIKITLDLPKVAADEAGSSRAGAGESREEDGAKEADEKPAKRVKLGGAGSSALLGMLPPPKRKIAAPAAKPALAVNKAMAPKAVARPVVKPMDDDDDDAVAVPHAGTSTSASASAAKDAADDLDLFGLSGALASRPAAVSAKPATKPVSITSAPAVANFVPPPPGPNDPYPGYYQLPSGAWAAYEPEYYASFFAGEENPDEGRGEDGRVGKQWDGLDDLARGSIVDVDVQGGLAAARLEEERKARMVKPKLPGDEFEYKPIGQVKGLAAERHQLTSLLNTAYTQRDALEARIAENKKNMRMASTKYGF
ncbi:hypothetical protein Q5752_005778 [Cryptotrichosporon argae]